MGAKMGTMAVDGEGQCRRSIPNGHGQTYLKVAY